jgi:hypothetical protein
VQLRDVVIVTIGVLGPPTSFQVNKLAKTFLNPPGTGPIDDTLSLSPSPTSIIPLQPVFSIDSSLPMSATASAIRTGIAISRSLSLGTQDRPAKLTLWQRLRSTSARYPSQEGQPTGDYTPQFTAHATCELPTTGDPQWWYPRMTAPRPVAVHSQYPNFAPGGRDFRWEKSESHPEWTWVGPLLWVHSALSTSFNALIRLTG